MNLFIGTNAVQILHQACIESVILCCQHLTKGLYHMYNRRL